MNKVTQSIYKNKVDELEKEVRDLQNLPVQHHYIVTFGSNDFQNVHVYIFTTQDIPLTASDMYDYMLEATKYHNNKNYRFIANGWDKRSSNWKPICAAGAGQMYPSQTVTEISFYTTDMATGVQSSFKISKETFISMSPGIIKIY